MKKFLVMTSLLTSCYPLVTPIPLDPPAIVFKCTTSDATAIQLVSTTPIFTPLLTVPRFPDGSIPVRYQFKDFTGMSELLKLTWCPINATLEYSRKAGGERFTVGGP